MIPGRIKKTIMGTHAFDATAPLVSVLAVAVGPNAESASAGEPRGPIQQEEQRA